MRGIGGTGDPNNRSQRNQGQHAADGGQSFRHFTDLLRTSV
jgi:hypothetical protein